ncbi:ABC transporter substrate-binding protein, partial [Desulfococcaceae bacterium HSG8]|nr:ABC transporter substrate-binding protein [Desulfococcaceae bacterium HSG8]
WIIVGICGTAYSEDTEPIKLAVCEALSGKFQYAGEGYLDGVKYAVQEINSQGGLLGRKIEIIPIDNTLNPDVAVQKVSELLRKEPVKYVLTGLGSHIGLALSPLAKEKKFILFSYATAADSLTGEKCNRYFFRTAASTSMHSGALAFWVVKNGYKKVFGIAQDYAFGRSAMAAFKKKIQKLDPSVKLTGEIYHPLGEKDFTPHINKIIASDAEIVFTPNWGSDLIMLVKQSKSLGMKSEFAGYYINDPDVIKGVGDDEAVIGSFTAENYMISIPTQENKRFVEAFYKDKGYYPTLVRGKAYTATRFWAEAVKAAGKDDVEAVIKAWEGLLFEGPAGKWYMRPCDHQTLMPIWIAKLTKENPFFDHAFVDKATNIPAKFIAVPCNETGCPGLGNSK